MGNNCMLCNKVDSLNEVDITNYIAEEKMDGERIMVIKKGSLVKIINRRGASKGEVYPEILEGVKTLPFDFIVDGEVCSTNGIFNDLQKRALLRDCKEICKRRGVIPVIYHIFDILEVNSVNVTTLPLLKRKEKLQEAFKGLNLQNIKIISYVQGEVQIKQLWGEVKLLNKEGIILKVKDSVYSFKRSSSWLKLKNWKEEVISFTGFQINNAGVKVNDGFNEVQIQGKDRGDWVVNEIKTKGYVKVVVQYLERTGGGKLRFPSCKEVIGFPI